MSDQFVAEIRIYPFNFPPTGWALCNGQILPISQNTALFSLLGTTYGGNGQSTFALPDMISSAPMQPGQGPGLSLHDLGEQGGEEAVTLLQSEMPLHPHTLMCSTTNANRSAPGGNSFAKVPSGGTPYLAGSPAPPLTSMAPQALPLQGGDQPHNNMQPYLTLNFCIALQGIFPARP